jgi:DNA-directed RNA polymerase subunit RPC12/RpoP
MSEQLRFRCPGCGSDLETPEGTVSNCCRYCGLVSLLGRPGRVVKSYYQPNCDPLEARVIAERQVKKEGWPLFCDTATVALHYVPFYRFRGLALSCLSFRRAGVATTALEPGPDTRSYELRARNLDLTLPGCSGHPFGLTSLGVRPQAVPAWAYRDAELPAPAVVWPVDRHPDEAEKAAFKMNESNLALAQMNKKQEFSEMVGEHQNLIYFPVYVISGKIGSPGVDVHVVLDGLSRRVLSASRGLWADPLAGDPVNTITELVPEPHHCPNCGADFLASERSIVYACTNCSRLWLLENTGYRALASPQVGEGLGDLYPFWRIQISFSRSPGFDTVGAFARLLTADIPLLDKRKRHLPFFAYVPAFAGADAEWQVLTAVRMIRTQPLVEPARQAPLAAVDACLPEPESREFARFAWNWLRMSYLNLRGDHFDWREAATGAAELAWLPISCERLARSVGRAHREGVRAT